MGAAVEHVTIHAGFVQKCCRSCGAYFYIGDRLEKGCSEQGRTWWCPACGHKWHYGKTEAARVQEELELQKKRTEWAQEDARQVREARDRLGRRVAAHKGHNTRLRRRLEAGKCPCCSVHFEDLEEHITTEHPGYGGD